MPGTCPRSSRRRHGRRGQPLAPGSSPTWIRLGRLRLPTPPAGEIRAALLGRTLTAAHRRGKSMWCDTSAVPAGRRPAGPLLGIHLGMSGKIVIADGRGRRDRRRRLLGARPGRRRLPVPRFTLTFADGGALMLVDPRRLGRVRLDPPVEALGPDAHAITPKQFRAAFGGHGAGQGPAARSERHRGHRQPAGRPDPVAGEDQPGPAGRRADPAEIDRLLRRSAPDGQSRGGRRRRAHPARSSRSGGPRPPARAAAAPMAHGTVGGRTTWWCPREQS